MDKSFCVKCKSKQAWADKPTLVKTANNRIALTGNCRKCHAKMFRFVAKSALQDGNGLLSSIIGKPIPGLSKIPLLNILF